MLQPPTLRALPDPPPLECEASGSGDPRVVALGEEVAELREAVFSLGDLARRALPLSAAGIHVALQAAAHELGQVERLLVEVG